MGISFNDYCLAILSASYHEYYKQIGQKIPKELSVFIPISIRNGNPKSPDDVKVDNSIIPLSMKFPCNSNVAKNGPIIRKITKKLKAFEFLATQ